MSVDFDSIVTRLSSFADREKLFIPAMREMRIITAVKVVGGPSPQHMIHQCARKQPGVFRQPVSARRESCRK